MPVRDHISTLADLSKELPVHSYRCRVVPPPFGGMPAQRWMIMGIAWKRATAATMLSAFAVGVQSGTAWADSSRTPAADPVAPVIANAVSAVQDILDQIQCVIDPTALQLASIGSATPYTQRPPLWKCDPGSQPPTGSSG
jgi:hypothetical protein